MSKLDIFQEEFNKGADWEYATLSETAKKFGGPEKFIEDMFKSAKAEGLSEGRLQGMLAITAPIILFLCGKQVITYFNKKNKSNKDLNELLELSEKESVKLTDFEKKLLEQKNIEFLEAVEVLEKEGKSSEADKVRKDFDDWVNNFLVKKRIG